jgi:hypothetical protein
VGATRLCSLTGKISAMFLRARWELASIVYFREVHDPEQRINREFAQKSVQRPDSAFSSVTGKLKSSVWFSPAAWPTSPTLTSAGGNEAALRATTTRDSGIATGSCVDCERSLSGSHALRRGDVKRGAARWEGCCGLRQTLRAPSFPINSL